MPPSESASTNIELGPDGMMGQPPGPSDPLPPSPMGDLGHFLELERNPEFQRLAAGLHEASERTLKGIMLLPVVTIGDLLQREQLFGEWRGLKRLAAECEDRKTDLTEAVETEQRTKTTSNSST